MAFTFGSPSRSDSIDIVDLSIRARNALRRHGIDTIGELLDLVKAGTLKEIKGIGGDSEAEILVKTRDMFVAELGELPNEPGNKGNAVREIQSSYIDRDIRVIRRLLQLGLLHEDAELAGEPLGVWLSLSNDRYQTHRSEALSNAIRMSVNVCDELSILLASLSAERITALIFRYGSKPQTLDVVGQVLGGVTRERARQVCARLGEILVSRLALNNRMFEHSHIISDSLFALRMQTSLLIARDMGLDITFAGWKERIRNSGLIGDWPLALPLDQDPVEVMLTVCRITSELGVLQLGIPRNLQLAIDSASAGSPGVTARLHNSLVNLSSENRRLIERHANFSGAVNVKWLAEVLKLDLPETGYVLDGLGFEVLSQGWYVLPPGENWPAINRNDVFHHAVRKMSQYCGPLTTDDICSGLRHAVSRRDFPIPPPGVTHQVLERYGYAFEDDLYYWPGKIDESLSDSEQVIMNCIRTLGPVVHHSELAQAFLDSTLSFPSLHAALKRTPIFDRIENALYKLRGQTVADDDIARAEAVAERTPIDLEVTYDRTGKIVVTVNVSILTLGTGTLVSEQLPNLVGEWKCVVGLVGCDSVIVTKDEFRRIGRPLEHIGCRSGDRVRFVFNIWDRTVSVEKVG